MSMYSARSTAHVTTTKRLPAIYPCMSSSNLGVAGPYMGDDVYTRLRHYFNPIELLRRGAVNNYNIITLGDINHGKSALNKIFVWRNYLLYGWQSLVLDRKGEYDLLAAAMGVSPFRFQANNELTINLLDLDMMTIEQQLELLKTFGRTLHTNNDSLRSSNDTLTAFEINALAEALSEAHRINPNGAEIKHLIQALNDPSRGFLRALQMGIDEYRTAIRPLMHGFRRLTDVDLQGMFDGPTSKRFNFKEMPSVFFRLDALTGDARRLMLACATHWTTGGWARKRPIIDIRININDEGYEDFTDPDYVGSLNRGWKLGRQFGVINILTLHHQTQFLTGGNTEVTADLIENTATVISHYQSAEMLRKTRDALSFNDAQSDIIPTLDVGDAFWRVGKDTAYFQHLTFVDKAERDFCFTNQAAQQSDVKLEKALTPSDETLDRIGTHGERIRQRAALAREQIADQDAQITDRAGESPMVPIS